VGGEIIWNFDNVQKAYATRGYEAKWRLGGDPTELHSLCVGAREGTSDTCRNNYPGVTHE
jgi:hypothetical protein